MPVLFVRDPLTDEQLNDPNLTTKNNPLREDISRQERAVRKRNWEMLMKDSERWEDLNYRTIKGMTYNKNGD